MLAWQLGPQFETPAELAAIGQWVKERRPHVVGLSLMSNLLGRGIAVGRHRHRRRQTERDRSYSANRFHCVSVP